MSGLRPLLTMTAREWRTLLGSPLAWGAAAGFLALGGLASLMHTVERAQERLNPDLAVSAIVVCRLDSRTRLAAEVVEKLRERFGRLLLRSAVRETVRLREAWSHAKPITTYAPRSTGAEDYRAVAREFARRRP